MKRLTCIIIVLALALSVTAAAAGSLDRAADYCLTELTEPGSGSQWVVVALAMGNFDVEKSWFDGYLANMKTYVTSVKGKLSARKYTDYSAAVIGITAAGGDPTDFGGYDLTAPLQDFDKTVLQGVNGAVYALIALDFGGYDCEIRQKYVDYILDKQLSDGGWAITGSVSDADVTAMAVQALSKYAGQTKVKTALSASLTRLKAMASSDGGYSSYGEENCESCAQVILALCQLGEAPGDSLMKKLRSYQLSDGSFAHTAGGKSASMATGQAFMALVAAKRISDGLGGIYDYASRYGVFTDVTGHWAENAIYNVCEKGLFDGISPTRFAPDETLSRAMAVTVLYRLAGQPATAGKSDFSDVLNGAWYEKAVAWAADKGIVNGRGDGSFAPGDEITRWQLAAIIGRYAEYAGKTAPSMTAYSQKGGAATRAEAADLLTKYMEGSR